MEKLQPALKQIFWICTGFVVLLAVSGWWLAIGSLHEKINQDKSTLQTYTNDAEAGEDAPNSVWTAGAKQVNQKHQQSFDLAERDLHGSQIKYRTYPESLASELPRSFGAPIPETALRRQYAKLYNKHFVEQLRVLDPFIVQDNSGLIAVTVKDVTHVNVAKWKYKPPTASEIWTAQEDLWLVRSLFESISKVNDQAGAERLGKAPVRELSTLYLRGGSREKGNTSARGGTGSPRFGSATPKANTPTPAQPSGGSFLGMTADSQMASQMMTGDRGDDDDDDGGLGFGSGGRQSKSRSVATAGKPFEGSLRNDLLTEEFGPDTSPRRGASAALGMLGGGGIGGRFESASNPVAMAMNAGSSSMRPAASSRPGFGKKSGTTQNSKKNDGPAGDSSRYVDDAAEYRTRAFLLHVKVEPGYIPVLLAELTNSSFPVEIIRVDSQFRNGGSGRRGGTGPGAAAAMMDDDDDVGFGASGLAGMAMMMGRGGIGGRNFPGNGMRGRGSAGLLASLASKDFNPNDAAKGQAQLSAALSDPALSELRIAGLLTIYRTKEENEAVEETAEMEIKDAQTSAADSLQNAADGTLGSEADGLSATADIPEQSDSDASDVSETLSPADAPAANEDSTEAGAGENDSGE